MLARSAQGVYWMARYLERAGFMCRLLHSQTEALVDRPIREIHFGWRRIYTAMERHPLGGILRLHPMDDYNLVDAYFLADELTFERANPESLLSCFERGRENARQMRHCISDEMWTSLNTEYLRVQNVKMQDIWLSSPSSFYSDMAASIDMFAGVATATMYRDEGWHFLRFGQFIERLQFTCALLLAQRRLQDNAPDYDDSDWSSLLSVFHALEVYERRYSIEIDPHLALNLLVADRQLPESLRRSVGRAGQELASIGDGPNNQSSAAAQRLAGRLEALIRFDWEDREDKEAFLRQVRRYSWQLHDLVAKTYFDYAVEDTPQLITR